MSESDVAYDTLEPGEAAAVSGDLSLVLDVPVEVAVEVGRTTMTIRETLAIAPGSIIALDRMAGDPLSFLGRSHWYARRVHGVLRSRRSVAGGDA